MGLSYHTANLHTSEKLFPNATQTYRPRRSPEDCHENTIFQYVIDTCPAKERGEIPCLEMEIT
jgi:hypothetical protein